MAYFVTGATGFIGRFLVANLRKRGEPVHVLVRKSSLKKLAAAREHWGATDKEVIAVVGDVGAKNLGVADADLRKLKGKAARMREAITGVCGVALTLGVDRPERCLDLGTRQRKL